MPGHLGAVERHGTKETQRRNRAVDARRTYASPGLMELKTAKILRDGLIRRTAQKRCESLDLPDIVAARLFDEVAHSHVFDHALAQRADGFLAHRGAPCMGLSLPSANFAKLSSGHLLSPSGGAHSSPSLASRRCCLAALSSQSPCP